MIKRKGHYYCQLDFVNPDLRGGEMRLGGKGFRNKIKQLKKEHKRAVHFPPISVELDKGIIPPIGGTEIRREKKVDINNYNIDKFRGLGLNPTGTITCEGYRSYYRKRGGGGGYRGCRVCQYLKQELDYLKT